MEMKKKFWSIYPLPALLSPLPFISITTEKITACTDKAGKGASKVEEIHPFVL